MTTTRAAKYLAPIDIGKTVTFTDADADQIHTGELTHIDALDYNIELGIMAGKDSGHYRVEHEQEVALTGQPSPEGWDQAPPAEPLPAPIPAAQAADDDPEHEHIATLQNPERCTRCDAVLEYDENGNRK